MAIEKSISLVQRGAVLLSRGTTNPHFLGELRQENVSALCIGLVFFSLATSMFFTPLPIFFSKNPSPPDQRDIHAFPAQLNELSRWLLLSERQD